MKNALQNARRFIGVYCVLLARLFRFSPRSVVFITVAQIAGAAIPAMMVGLLTKGFHFLQADLEMGVAKSVLPGVAPQPMTLLWMISGAIVVLGIFGALASWLGTSGGRKLGRHYRLHLSARVLEVIREAVPGTLRVPGRYAAESTLEKFLVSYGGNLNFAIVSLFNTIRTGASVVFLAICLLVIAPGLSLGLFGAAAVLLVPLLYAVHLRTHQASRQWYLEGGGRAASQRLVSLCRNANSLAPAPGEKPSSEERTIEHDSIILDNLQQMEYGRLSGARSQFYSSAFRAVFLGGGLMLLGTAALRPHSLPMDLVLVFLVASAMLLQSAGSFLGALALLVWHTSTVTAAMRYSDAVLKSEGSSAIDPVETANPQSAVDRTASILVVSDVSLSRTGFWFHLENLYRLGVVDRPPRDLSFEVVSLRDTLRPDWDRCISHLSGGGGPVLIDPGKNTLPAKVEFLSKQLKGQLIFFTGGWEGELDPFERIVKISADGEVTQGDRDFWKGDRAEGLRLTTPGIDGSGIEDDELSYEFQRDDRELRRQAVHQRAFPSAAFSGGGSGFPNYFRRANQFG